MCAVGWNLPRVCVRSPRQEVQFRSSRPLWMLCLNELSVVESGY